VKQQRVTRRTGGEDGFVMVAAIVVLAVVTTLAGAALALSLRSVTTSQVDRNRALALGAADEGADVAGWRMNKLLVSSGGASLLGFANGLLANLGCVQVNGNLALSVTELNLTGGSSACPVTATEDAGNGASFSYVMQTDLNLNNQLNLGSLIERRALITGTAYGQQRRILVTYRLNPGISSLFERYRYVECTPLPPAGSTAFDAGCPDPGS
jgi:type II secretory pathway pseudopilin PulG